MPEINGKLSESRVLRCHFYQIGDICWILITVGDLIRTWWRFWDFSSRSFCLKSSCWWQFWVVYEILSPGHQYDIGNISNVSSTTFVSNLVIWSFGNDLWHYRSMRFFSKTFLIGTHLSSKLTWSDLRTIQFQNLQFKFNDYQSFFDIDWFSRFYLG